MPEYLTLQPNESKLIGRITNYKTNLIIQKKIQIVYIIYVIRKVMEKLFSVQHTMMERKFRKKNL